MLDSLSSVVVTTQGHVNVRHLKLILSFLCSWRLVYWILEYARYRMSDFEEASCHLSPTESSLFLVVCPLGTVVVWQS